MFGRNLPLVTALVPPVTVHEQLTVAASDGRVLALDEAVRESDFVYGVLRKSPVAAHADSQGLMHQHWKAGRWMVLRMDLANPGERARSVLFKIRARDLRRMGVEATASAARSAAASAGQRIPADEISWALRKSLGDLERTRGTEN